MLNHCTVQLCVVFSPVWYAEPAGDNRYFPQLHCQTETGSGVPCQAQVALSLVQDRPFKAKLKPIMEYLVKPR